MSNRTSTNDTPYEVRVGDFFRRSLRHKLLISSMTLVLGATSLALSYLAVENYDAEVLLAPAERDSQASGLAALTGQFSGLASLAGMSLPGSADGKEEWLALLESRSFTSDFIKDFGLKQELFSADWDDRSKAWRNEQPSMNDAIARFAAVRNVRRIPRGNLVSVRVRWKDPERAADWANQLVSRLNERVRQDAISEARSSIDFLDKEQSETSVIEVRQGIYRMMESQIQTIVYANVNPEFAFRVIDPAVASDEEDYVTPNRLLYALAGSLAGLFASLFFVFVRKEEGQS